jgi:hypothetical protein
MRADRVSTKRTASTSRGGDGGDCRERTLWIDPMGAPWPVWRRLRLLGIVCRDEQLLQVEARHEVGRRIVLLRRFA